MFSRAGLPFVFPTALIAVALLCAVSPAIAHDTDHGRGRDFVRINAGDAPDPVAFTGSAVSTMSIDAYVKKLRGLGAPAHDDTADCDDDRRGSNHPREWFVRVFYTIRQGPRGTVVNRFEREVKIQPPFEVVQLPAQHGRARPRFIHVPTIRIAWNGKRTNGALVSPGVYNTEVYAVFTRSHSHLRSRGRDRIIDISDTVKGTIKVIPSGTPPPTLTVTAPADGAIVAATSITATGSVAGGQAPVSLTINSQSTPLAANGTFSKSVNLVEGANALNFVATDGAGRTATRTITVTRDTIAPVLTVVPANGAVVIVARPTLSVAYSDSPGSGINVSSFSARLDNVDVTAGFNAGATGGSFTPATALNNGSHSLVAAVRDRAGNLITVTSTFLVSVSAAPTIAITQPANNAITAQAAIVVSGPVTGSGALTVTVNGVSATISNGTFTATVPLVAGTNTITATVQDTAAQQAQASVTVVRDSVAPTLTVSPSNGAVVTEARPTLSVTYSDSPGSGINVSSFSARLDNVDVTAGFNAGATGGSFTPASDLSNGGHSLVASVRDLAGNLTTVTSSFTVSVAAVPTIAITQPANNAITAQASIVVSGPVTGTGALTVTVNGVSATISNGTFTATVPLVAGSNTITAIVQDTAAQQAQASVTVVRDSVAPVVAVVRPATGSEGRDPRPVLEVSYQDAAPSSGLDLTTFEATLDSTNIAGSFTTAASGATFTPTTDLADGAHTLVSAIQDRAGNRTQASSTFTIDTAAPLLTQSPSNGSFTATGTPTLAATYADPGTGIDQASFRAFIDGVDSTSSFTVGAVQASFTIPAAGRLSAGSHTFRSVIADRVGNVSDQTVTFVVDDVAPTVAITAPQDGTEVVTATPEIRFDFADNAGGSGIAPAAVRLTLDGVDVSGQLEIGTGSAQLTPAALPDGEHQAVASVTDRAGNTASATSRFTVRTAPPVPTGAGFAVGDVLDATNGTPIAGATVRVFGGGGATVQTSATGKFALPLLAGEYRVEIEKAGFIGPVERRVTILTGRDSVADPIVLYPLDSRVTPINASAGGTATNADSSIQVTFAAGSLGANANVQITATPDVRSMPEIPSETLVHETAFDIKPEGMAISSPATISVANSRNLSAGHRMAVYAFNHTTGLFEVVGTAEVLPDGTRIVGQTTHFSRLYFACNETRPQAGAGKAPPEQRASNRAPRKDPEPQHPNKPKAPCALGFKCNSPGVLTKTGELVEQLDLPPVWTLNSPAALSFTYRSHAAKPQSVVRVSFNHSAVPALPQEQQVTVAVGTQVTQARYAPTNDRVSQHNVLWNAAGGDGQKVKSGSYPWTARLTALFDGVDPNTGQPNRIPFGLASDEHGYVLVQNLEKSVFGSGWNLGSLAEVHANPDGTALMVENGGGLTHFLRGWNVRTFAGSLTVEDFQGDGGQLETARFSDPGGMVSLADGTVLVADTGNRRIRSISPSGTIQTIYGTGEAGFAGDGGPAAQARFNRPTQMARDDTGNVYVLDALDNNQQVVRRINSAGIVTSIAGAGVTGHHVSSFAATPAGDIYYSDFFTGKVFRRTAAGVHSVLDSGLPQGSLGDGNTVSRASFNYVRSVAYDPEIGALYVQEFDRIRRVDASGIVRLFAGAGTRDAENTAAIGVRLFSFDLNASIAVGRDGSVYVLQGQFGDILRRITRAGTIERVVGTTTANVYNGSGQLEGADTTYVNILGNRALGLGFAPDGNLLVGVGGTAAGSYIVSVGHTADGISWYRAPAGETTILRGSASGFTTLSSGLLVRTFDPDGHMTTSTDSNGQAWTYEWAQDGTLTRITDPVQRNYVLSYQSGKLASITDPAGRTTQFTVNASGDLAEVVLPDGAHWKYTYADHLLQTTEDPRGGITRITYGADNMVRGIDEPDQAHAGYVPEDSLHLIVPPATLPLTPPTLAMVTPDDFESIVTLPSGSTEKFRTTKNGIVTRHVDELGRTTSAALDDRERPTTYTRADGTTITAAFDARGNPQFTLEDIPASTPLVMPRAADRLVTQYTFDPTFDKPTEIVVGQSRITMAYDTRGNLSRVTNAVNASTLATYDSRGLLTELTNPRGFKTRFGYDTSGNLSTLTDAAGAIVRLTRDGAGNVTRIENRRGFPTTMTYDAAGRVATITDALQGTVTLGRNTSGEVTSIRDQRGNTTTLGYDQRGRLTSATDALNRTSTWTYDGQGGVRTFTDAKQRTIEYTYDPKHRLVLEKSPSGSERRLEYDIHDNISTIIDPENRTRSFVWGSLGQLLGVRDGNNAVVAEYLYDNGNRLTKIFDGIGGFYEVLYDQAQRISAVNHGSVNPPPGGADNLQLTFIYDENDNIVREFRFVRDITRQFDSMDRVVGTTSSFPAESNFFTYDPEGNLTSFRNGNNATWRFAYDPLNRLEREEDPETPTNVTLLEYDAASNLTRRTDALGRVTSIDYDPLNRWIRRTFSTGQETAAYDETGQLTQVEGNGATINQTFDVEDRLKTQILSAVGLNRSLLFDYDRSHRRTALSINGVATQSYQWDPNGRLAALTGPSGVRTDFQYDLLGNVTRKTLPNNVQLDQTFDGRGRVIRQLYTHPLTGTLEDLRYQRSRTDVIVNDSLRGQTSYSYDFGFAAQLTHVQHPDGWREEFTYDRANNRTRRLTVRGPEFHVQDFTYSPGNRLLTQANDGALTTYGYDNVGNLTSIASSAGTTSLTWDGRDQLVQLRYPDGGISRTSYLPGSPLRYEQQDPDGRTTRFLFDPGTANVLQELDASGSTSVQFLHGLGLDETLARVENSQTLTFLTDHLESTRNLVDSTGAIANTYDYWANGEIRQAQETVANSVRFTGRELDRFSGLQYTRARWYSAELGRFISADPISWAGGTNFYAYSGNNPATYSDPTGLLHPALGVLLYYGGQAAQFYIVNEARLLFATFTGTYIADRLHGLDDKQAGERAAQNSLAVLTFGRAANATFAPSCPTVTSPTRGFNPASRWRGPIPADPTPRQLRIRELVVRNAARNFGYDPSKVRYRHLVSDKFVGGRVNTQSGEITIDAYSFDPVFLRAKGLSGPRPVVAHEIGHRATEVLGMEQSEELAHSFGASLPTISPHEFLQLLGFSDGVTH